MELSLNNIDQLPSIENLKKNAQSLALLDAILMPDWEYRYFSFNSKWNVGEMMSSMRDGSGNEYFILFCPTGAVGKVFYSQMRIGATVNPVPETFSSFKSENAFSLTDATYFFLAKIGRKEVVNPTSKQTFLVKVSKR